MFLYIHLYILQKIDCPPDAKIIIKTQLRSYEEYAKHLGDSFPIIVIDLLSSWIMKSS